ncbi:protein of unknown function [Pararobbsia alpina]
MIWHTCPAIGCPVALFVTIFAWTGERLLRGHSPALFNGLMLPILSIAANVGPVTDTLASSPGAAQ